MFIGPVFFAMSLLYFFLVEYAIILNKTKILCTSYQCDPKEAIFFNTKIDVKYFIYIFIIMINGMTPLLYFTCTVRLLVTLIDYLKYCFDGTIEMSRDTAHSLYCLMWLTIYFYMADNVLYPHLATILGSVIGINLINKRIDP